MSRVLEGCQERFEAQWGHLRHPAVRALAWLLSAPDLLDPASPTWHGKIASLGDIASDTQAWLDQLDRDPAALDAALGERLYTRLGLYAEKLMAFYFREHGRLVAHGLQVRASHDDTVGEFDFLLDAGPDAVEHIEFATKFYLLEGNVATDGFDAFVGPNLADTLGAKMRKILDKQLALGAHPAAQALLPRPVVRATALVKGWLFYRAGQDGAFEGINGAHCRGFWCTVGELDELAGEQWIVVPRLRWLAPYKANMQANMQANVTSLGRQELGQVLAAHFAASPMPLLVAGVCEHEGCMRETVRGFVVPDDWRARAAARRSA
jgi:uncharacterized protein